MKISRLDYDPGSSLVFFEEALSALGALCERTWHDRLQVVAEGRAAKLWNEAGNLQAQELRFVPAENPSIRDAGQEVFPGCPLTFRLAELLRPSPLVLEKVVLGDAAQGAPPERAVLEKRWKHQFPATRQWRLKAEATPGFHFSLAAIVRCEIQAIDQHWSLHRLALALPEGEADESLAGQLPLMEVQPAGDLDAGWPPVEAARWWSLLRQAVEAEISPDLQAMRARQEQYLRREIQRIDDYFAQYEQELARRGSRGKGSGAKTDERLAAARAEHARRRLDQVARHEIRVQPHVDALLLLAEPSWQTSLEVGEQRTLQQVIANFVPRARRWFRVS